MFNLEGDSCAGRAESKCRQHVHRVVAWKIKSSDGISKTTLSVAWEWCPNEILQLDVLKPIQNFFFGAPFLVAVSRTALFRWVGLAEESTTQLKVVPGSVPLELFVFVVTGSWVCALVCVSGFRKSRKPCLNLLKWSCPCHDWSDFLSRRLFVYDTEWWNQSLQNIELF